MATMMQDHHDVFVDDGIEPSSASTSTHQVTHHHSNDDDTEVGIVSTGSNNVDVVTIISSSSVEATAVEENTIPSSRTSKEESSAQVVDNMISSYEGMSDMTTQDDDGATTTNIKAMISWQQLNETLRSELLNEGKSPTWREEWLGVHVPPSEVIRGGAPTMMEVVEIEEEEEVVQERSESLLLDQEVVEEEEDDDIVELVDSTEEHDSEVVIPVEEPPPPPPPPLPIVKTPPVEEIAQPVPQSSPPSTFFSSLFSLLSSPGPSIPLYPLLLTLTTLYILKQALHTLFGFKSRTRVTRSMNRVLYNKKQFVIPKEQLLQHIEWMRLRSDLRRMRERNSRKMTMRGVTSGSSEDNDEGDRDGGEGSGSSGMNGSYGDNSGGNSGGGGGGGGTYRGNGGSNDRKDNNENGTDDGNGKSHHQTYMLGLLKAEDICPTRKILMLAELFSEVMDNKDKEIAGLKSNIKGYERAVKESNEKASTFEKQLAEVTSKKEKEIAMLKSKIEEYVRANKESSEKASTFEEQCKEMQEQVALQKEEIAMLDLVYEKMEAGELAGLEIDGENCLRSCLGSLTNVNEEDEDSMPSASTDSEWDRLEEENKLLQAENDLLQESLDCLRKELDEVRSDAAIIMSHELKPAKSPRDLSPSNDLTMVMADESFECMDSNTNSTPLFEGVESPIRAENVTGPPRPSSPSNAEVINTIQTLLKKCAQDTQRASKENGSTNQNLNQDLLQLLANVRKLDGDHSKENMKANSPRRRDRTKDIDTSGRGRSRHRAGIRSKILFKSPLALIREKSFSGRKSPSSPEEMV